MLLKSDDELAILRICRHFRLVCGAFLEEVGQHGFQRTCEHVSERFRTDGDPMHEWKVGDTFGAD